MKTTSWAQVTMKNTALDQLTVSTNWIFNTITLWYTFYNVHSASFKQQSRVQWFSESLHVKPGRWVPMFRTAQVKMEALCSATMLTPTHKLPGVINTKNHTMSLHFHENVRYHTIKSIFHPF
jgi:hypothetical protein